jgi:hypothetical protein
LSSAFEIQLGGAHGAQQGWGQALAVVIPSDQPEAIALRSELGNRLAELSTEVGLAAMGVVAYYEVRSLHHATD